MIACRTVIAQGHRAAAGPARRSQRPSCSRKTHRRRAQQLDWPYAAVRDAGRRSCGAWRAAGASLRRRAPRLGARAWTALPAAERAEFERMSRGELPDGWRDVLHGYKRRAPEREPDAERHQSSPARSTICWSTFCPNAWSAAPTSKRRPTTSGACRRSPPTTAAAPTCTAACASTLMGAMANGMAAHGGVVPLAVTYLAFSDYERPAMRMAALMGLPVKFVFSHDSIGVGKNGPTHQPVEILASLRAMPNMLVMRPADAVEAAECWEARARAPRRAVDDGVRTPGAADCAAPARGREPVATRRLRAGRSRRRRACGHAAGDRVRSRTRARGARPTAGRQRSDRGCLDAVLGTVRSAGRRVPGDACCGPVDVRVAVEAALRFGWDRWLGERGGFVGMTGFGASGPADALYAHFGITPEAIVAEAKRCLGR